MHTLVDNVYYPASWTAAESGKYIIWTQKYINLTTF